jgi:hypothetical protein
MGFLVAGRGGCCREPDPYNNLVCRRDGSLRGLRRATAGSEGLTMPLTRELPLYLSLVVATSLANTAATAQEIDTCGLLAISEGCVIFEPDTGGAFTLDTTGGFGAGDRIRVVGTLNLTCVPICAAASGCIITSTVEACSPEFFGCGSLVQDGPCVLFVSDSYGSFVLSTTGGFNIGARVQVSGTLEPDCGSVCLPSSGCIAVNTIVGCGEQFSSCGLLVQRPTCVVFVADQGGTFELGNLAGFAAGDRVLVTGAVDPTCVPTCTPVDGCIMNNSIAECGGTFSGCGTLVQGPDCVLFQADSGGTFALSELDGFTAGDRVSVSGTISTQCATTCTQAQACIVDNTIAACEPPPPSPCVTTSAALMSLSIAGLLRARRRA